MLETRKQLVQRAGAEVSLGLETYTESQPLNIAIHTGESSPESLKHGPEEDKRCMRRGLCLLGLLDSLVLEDGHCGWGARETLQMLGPTPGSQMLSSDGGAVDSRWAHLNS